MRLMRLPAATCGIALLAACVVLLVGWGVGMQLASASAFAPSHPLRVVVPARTVPVHPLGPASRPASQVAVDPAEGDPGEGAWEGSDFHLTGVLIAPGVRLAILRRPGADQSLHVRLDDAPTALGGWRLVEVQPRSVRFDGPGGSRTLTLQAFDLHAGPPAVQALANEPIAPPDTEPTPETAGEQLARLRRRLVSSREDARHLMTAEEWAAATNGDGVLAGVADRSAK